MNKNKKGILSREFYCQFLPREPLIGVKIANCELIGKDKVARPMFRIEIGFLFITFSYTNVDYSDLE